MAYTNSYYGSLLYCCVAEFPPGLFAKAPDHIPSWLYFYIYTTEIILKLLKKAWLRYFDPIWFSFFFRQSRCLTKHLVSESTYFKLQLPSTLILVKGACLFGTM